MTGTGAEKNIGVAGEPCSLMPEALQIITRGEGGENFNVANRCNEPLLK
jgi:hypothetical protein